MKKVLLLILFSMVLAGLKAQSISHIETTKNWDDQAKEKYAQAFQHITKANPHIRPDKITIEHMYKLKTE